MTRYIIGLKVVKNGRELSRIEKIEFQSRLLNKAARFVYRWKNGATDKVEIGVTSKDMQDLSLVYSMDSCMDEKFLRVLLRALFNATTRPSEHVCLSLRVNQSATNP